MIDNRISPSDLANHTYRFPKNDTYHDNLGLFPRMIIAPYEVSESFQARRGTLAGEVHGKSLSQIIKTPIVDNQA